MVQLKAFSELGVDAIFVEFQFLMVQLKERQSEISEKPSILFQFLMVQLKETRILFKCRYT